ncbi:MAG: hypothetical protein J6O41_07375, partial [Clostridia bacterium]|nr:hypothetical protein [Clostridia bacterium]
FSFKTGYNTAITFMTNRDVAIYNVASPISPASLDATESCSSTEEKGAIYLDGYYYLSCLYGTNQFEIKIYDKSFIFHKKRGPYTLKTGSSISFFIKYSSQVFVGVVWFSNENTLELLEIDPDQIIPPSSYTANRVARDTSCIFVSKYQRIVCGFGKPLGEAVDIYQCSINIFYLKDKKIESQSNFKSFDCQNHHSRKLRANTDLSEDDAIFYYYFVGTDNNGYVSKVKMTSYEEISFDVPHLVIKGCAQSQDSFDLAEDKFLGYNVFSCVEYQYKTKIKIQLFKIDSNNNIIFYGNKGRDDFETFSADNEVSMINFIVLKDSLDFGFLSYRNNLEQKAYYTIFNKPTCDPMSDQDIPLNTYLDIDFSDILDNNYGESYIKIFYEEFANVFELIRINDVKFRFQSINSEPGYFKVKYQVRNNYFESDNCTIPLRVANCHPNCKTCISITDNFLDQECTECKEGFYIMNFPQGYYSPTSPTGKRNCCQKGVDCPAFLYEDTGIFTICGTRCMTCEGHADSCLTCYNNNELKNFSEYETEIQAIKLNPGTDKYFMKSGTSQCISQSECTNCYFNGKDMFELCYPSCETCFGKGNSTFHNCDRCDEGNGYFHIGIKNSYNCLLETEKPTNYYLNSENYVEGEAEQSRYFAPCSDVCSKCNIKGNNKCTECAIDAFQKFEDIENGLPEFECYKNKPAKNYFLDPEKKYYKKCYQNCKTCDKEEKDGFQNCLSCIDDYLLFNRNCSKHCPKTHYELEEKKCVLECPAYTSKEDDVVDADGTKFNRCLNCRTAPGTENCIYMGTRLGNLIGCQNCDSLLNTFLANSYYNIRDDCYEACGDCSQRGTETKMHCSICKDGKKSLVEEIGNCIDPGSIIDYFYEYVDQVTGISTYKKCYETCKTCDYGGNILTHNCTLCKDGYQFDPVTAGNCVTMCPYYWYIDSTTNKFTCTKEAKCPEDKPYFTEINKGCVEECSAAFHNNLRFFYRYKKTCVIQCPENSMKDDLLYVCHSLDDERDIFVYASNYIKQGISSVNNLLLYSSDGTKLFHLFNNTELGLKTYRNSSLSVGTSIIDLTNCINTLKNIKGFTSSEVLYVGVLDILRNDTSAPQFEYTILDHSGNKL